MAKLTLAQTHTTQRAITPNHKQPRRLLLVLASLPLLLFLLVPLIALVLRMSVADMLAHLSTPQVAQAITLSISTTLMTTLITVVSGTPVAYLLARHQFRGRTVLDTLLDLPMVLPPSVAGIALLIAFGRQGMVGSYLSDLGWSIPFTQAAVVLAQMFVAAPYFVKAAVSGFAGVEQELEQSAALDGAGPLQVFRAITVPLAWPALISGHGHDMGAGGGRIRRDDYFRRQFSGPHANHATGDLHRLRA